MVKMGVHFGRYRKIKTGVSPFGLPCILSLFTMQVVHCMQYKTDNYKEDRHSLVDKTD